MWPGSVAVVTPCIFLMQVTPSFLKQLIDKIKTESANLEATEEMAQIRQHFQNTLAHIEYMQGLKAEGASYEGLVV